MKTSKRLAKKLVAVIALALVSQLLVVYQLLGFFCESDLLFQGFSQLFSLLPGKAAVICAWRFTGSRWGAAARMWLYRSWLYLRSEIQR